MVARQISEKDVASGIAAGIRRHYFTEPNKTQPPGLT